MNAYATGENKIVFFQGLAKYLQSEDEFAAVIPQMEPSRYRDELVQMQGELTRLLAEVEAEAARPRD